jgi:2-oxoglutarate dehydrogenase E1 component
MRSPDESDPLLNGSSLAFAEELYLAYLRDPASVPEAWRRFFDDVPADGLAGRDALGPSFARRSLFRGSGARAAGGAGDVQHRADKLIRNYRVRGHRVADLNPLGRASTEVPELDPGYYGFGDADMGTPVLESSVRGATTLGELIEGLRETYTRSIGAQFMHIDDLQVRIWLQRRMEGQRNRRALSRETQLRILTKLTDAEIFEEFIQKKYIGAKSFSLEGGETLIPLLDLAIEKAGRQGVREIVFGMAHRGRLNVLANILGKSPRTIFREFDDVDPEMNRGRGDVKYHLGYSSDWTTQDGHTLHLSLAFNPSHLEFVNPVVLGRVRAKQDRVGDRRRERGMPILIHGDAAFIGEGIVQETLNLSELPGYRVGGALHVIVNNQLGFTTGPSQSRSTTYASDVAKMLQAPIFHVNGEDPEAVTQVIELALDFRERFGRDVVIDMYCYRRHGHNEGDEPGFTQPGLYDVIRTRSTVRESYLERLLTLGEVSRDDAEGIGEDRREHLERELSLARSDEFKPFYSAGEGIWAPYRGGPDDEVPDVDTGVAAEDAARLLAATTEVPDGFTVNSKIGRSLQARRAMASGERPLDWAAGEALAFASLAAEGTRVRLTGQDSERGTFSHRHALLHDPTSDATWMPLAHLTEDQAPVEIHNSPLSEAGVLGFEYGYSLDMPDGLVIWEAQFGDFVNAGQVIIDQFIASGEDKWRRLSGLVMLLPHGFEGQGPEHSSARLERFLQMCAEDNLQVAYPTTPAQIFHLLRRQVVRPWRKPLVVMTPKSLLRSPRAVSDLEELTRGRFQRAIPDRQVEPSGVRRILACSGKVYYDLLHERETREADDVALLRLEQLYPLPEADLAEALAAYPDGVPLTWVQEEPENMGAWRTLRARWGETAFGRPFTGVTRPASASPATGSGSSHRLEQQELLAGAFERTQ